jgi:hypothetical protein
VKKPVLTISRQLIARTCALSLALGFACGSSLDQLACAQTTVRLSGGVTHSDQLPPLPAEDRVGAVVRNDQAASNAGQGASMQQQQPQQMQALQAEQAAAARQAKQLEQARAAQKAKITAQAKAAREAQSVKQAQQALADAQSREALQANAEQQRNSQTNQPHISVYHPTGPGNQTGSPMAPRLQTMTNQYQFQQARPTLSAESSASRYQKNLQAIASLDLSHTGRGAMQSALKAGLRSRGPAVTVEVPFWLAGVWSRSEENETSRVELPSGMVLKSVGRQKAAVQDTFGTYKDKNGRIFMVVPLGTRGSVDRGFAIDRHQVTKYQLILTGKTTALVKVQATHTVVDKTTNKVIQAYQDEELNNYSLVQEGLVNTDSSVKVFDQNGAPKLLTRASSIERRIHK